MARQGVLLIAEIPERDRRITLCALAVKIAVIEDGEVFERVEKAAGIPS